MSTSEAWNNAVWEIRLGIRTRGGGDPARWGDESRPYGTTSYRTIFRALDGLDLRPSDVLVDLGCGKGRVICAAAARYRLATVIGVECDRGLVETARLNACALRPPHAPIVVSEQRAESYDGQGSAFYLFNPFGERTLREVVPRLRARAGLRLAYVNPVHRRVLDETAWLEEYGRFGDVSLWRMKAD